MRVVNLSRKPFLNRRPVARIAILLWILGGLLLVVNTVLYAQYLAGTTKNRELLAEIDAEIKAEEKALDIAVDRVRRLDLGDRNLKASFLNELIAQRTFPWSRLFDDLEDVLPEDIHLQSVAPKVQERESETKRTRRRMITPREARERSQRRRQQGDTEREAIDLGAATAVEEEDDVQVIELALVGRARSDEALLDFVDTLYGSERFVDPFLSQEMREGREVQFRITTSYLLSRSRTLAIDDAVSQVADAGGPSPGATSGDDPEQGPRVPVDRGAVSSAAPSPGAASSGAMSSGARDGGRLATDRGRGATPQTTQDQRSENDRDAMRRGRGTVRDRRTGTGERGETDDQDPRRATRRGGGTTVGVPARTDGTADPRGEPGEPGSVRVPDPETGPGEAGPDAETPRPDLTQPDASDSPRLRRIGRLRWPLASPAVGTPSPNRIPELPVGEMRDRRWRDREVLS